MGSSNNVNSMDYSKAGLFNRILLHMTLFSSSKYTGIGSWTTWTFTGFWNYRNVSLFSCTYIVLEIGNGFIDVKVKPLCRLEQSPPTLWRRSSMLRTKQVWVSMNINPKVRELQEVSIEKTEINTTTNHCLEVIQVFIVILGNFGLPIFIFRLFFFII